MFKNIPGNDQYRISLDGVIVNNVGEECTLRYDGKNIFISMFGMKRWIDRTQVALLAFFEVNLIE